MDRPFLFWCDELANNLENGFVEIDCSKKNKEKFVKTIMSVLTSMDNYFAKNGLYAYNNYGKFLDNKFMDGFDYGLLYPKFIQDNSLSEENLAGTCAIVSEYYNNIKISKQSLFDKPTICHEFIHYLTLNNFYHGHKKDGRFKVFVNSPRQKHHLIFGDNYMTKPTTLSEDVMQENTFLMEGLTQFLTEEIYPSDKGKAYVSQVEMVKLLCDLVGKQKVLGDFLQGNVDSIERFFGAETWNGAYTGNFADFLKYTQNFFEDSLKSKIYCFLSEINNNYKLAIKCIVQAYYNNLLKDSNLHSADEFMRLFDFCTNYGALPECFQILKKIVKSGKIENIESKRDIITQKCKRHAMQYADDKFKIGDFELEMIYGDDCINFVLTLGDKNKLNIKFDGVDGFENDFNQHSKTYLQEKARHTKFADGTSPVDIEIEVDGNCAKVLFVDEFGQQMHSVGINYGIKKNAVMFDETVIELDSDVGMLPID